MRHGDKEWIWELIGDLTNVVAWVISPKGFNRARDVKPTFFFFFFFIIIIINDTCVTHGV